MLLRLSFAGRLALLLFFICGCLAGEGYSLRSHLLQVLSSTAIPTSNRQQQQQLIRTVNSSAEQVLAASAQCANVSWACLSLQTVFHGSASEYADQKSTDFVNLTHINWSKTAWLQPACIIRPDSTVAIAAALKVVTLNNVSFAVRGVGHNANAGFGSVGSNGILIDLSQMRAVTLSKNQRSVDVYPGNRWIDVYDAVSTVGLGAVGTKEPGPGAIGGLIGGGDPFFPSLYGMACDNVLEYELILSNSSVVFASASSQPTLFRALKGGGPNFGIISKVTLRTVPISKAWWSFTSYNINQTENLLHALSTYQQAAEKDPKANVIFTLSAGGVLVGLLYADVPSTLPSVFAPFANIPAAQVLQQPRTGSIAQLSTSLGMLSSSTTDYRATLGLSTSASERVYQSLARNFRSASTQIPGSASLILSYQTKSSTLAATGDNVLGIEAVQQQWSAVLIQWKDPDDSASVQSFLQSYLQQMKTAVNTAGGRTLPFIFQNDAGAQTPLEGIGHANIGLLKRTSQSFDPQRVFQKLQTNGYLLSKTPGV